MLNQDPESSPFTELRAELRALVDKYELPGYVISVTQNQRTVFEDVYGLRNLNQGLAVDQDTIFRQYSMTKALVSVALMTFYDEGLVHLDDDVSKFLGDAWKPAPAGSVGDQGGLRVVTWDGIVRGKVGEEESLRSVGDGDSVYIVAQTVKQHTLDVDPKGAVRHRWPDRGIWQSFKINMLPPTSGIKHRIAFQAHTGSFLSFSDCKCVASEVGTAAWIVQTSADKDTLAVGQAFKLQHEETGEWLRIDEQSLDDECVVTVADSSCASEFMFEKQTFRIGVTEAAREPITLRHLLTHTSGLDYSGLCMPGLATDALDLHGQQLMERVESGEIVSLAAWVDELAKLPLRNHPGTKWDYGVNIDVIGRVLEVLGEAPLDEVLHRRLFGPLGMHSTSFSVTSADAKDRLSGLYQFPTGQNPGSLNLVDDPLNSDWLQSRDPTPPAMASIGLGAMRRGLLSTLPDYMKFCHMLQGGGELNGSRTLQTSTVELMTKVNHLELAVRNYIEPTNGDRRKPWSSFWDERAWGLFAAISKGFYGWGGAASTWFRIYPSSNTCLVFMSNCFCKMYDEVLSKHTGLALAECTMK